MKPLVGAANETLMAGAAVMEEVVESRAQRLKRIERIAIRMFGVANCLISIGSGGAQHTRGERSMEALESAFAESLGFPADPVFVRDARENAHSATISWVVGPPYVRFYAVYPITHQQTVIGSILLIDYAVRNYLEEDQQQLSELALLVEQDLRFDVLQAAYLEVQRQNRQLRRDSMIDPLMGTWNRAAIVRSLGIELERCQRAEKPLSLALVSIDDFQRHKLNFGLHISESILIKLASRLRSCIRPFDALGRYGIEEFLVVLPGASHLVIQAIAERIRAVIMTHPEMINEQTVEISVCVGTVSTDVFSNASADELINRTEHVLHAAKIAGANCIIHATPDPV